MAIAIIIVAILFTWAVVHGGTREKQPTVDMTPVICVQPPHVYEDEHDVSGLLEED